MRVNVKAAVAFFVVLVLYAIAPYVFFNGSSRTLFSGMINFTGWTVFSLVSLFTPVLCVLAIACCAFRGITGSVTVATFALLCFVANVFLTVSLIVSEGFTVMEWGGYVICGLLFACTILGALAPRRRNEPRLVEAVILEPETKQLTPAPKAFATDATVPTQMHSSMYDTDETIEFAPPMDLPAASAVGSVSETTIDIDAQKIKAAMEDGGNDSKPVDF